MSLNAATPLHLCFAHILVKGIDDKDAMRASEQRLPEAFEVIPTSVVCARKFNVLIGVFASNATLIAHGFDDALPVLHDHYRRMVPRKDTRVTSLGLSPLDVFELTERPRDFLSGDSLAFSYGLRDFV